MAGFLKPSVQRKIDVAELFGEQRSVADRDPRGCDRSKAQSGLPGMGSEAIRQMPDRDYRTNFRVSYYGRPSVRAIIRA